MSSEPEMGIEPMTSVLPRPRSDLLSYTGIQRCRDAAHANARSGDIGTARTHPPKVGPTRSFFTSTVCGALGRNLTGFHAVDVSDYVDSSESRLERVLEPSSTHERIRTSNISDLNRAPLPSWATRANPKD